MPATVTAALDRTSYAPGDTMTLTVQYTVPEESKVTLTAVLDYVGGSVESAAVSVPVKDVDVIDDSGRQWTVASDDGATATLTATA